MHKNGKAKGKNIGENLHPNRAGKILQGHRYFLSLEVILPTVKTAIGLKGIQP